MKTKRRRCLCCGKKVRMMVEVDYCGALCRRGKCGHGKRG